MKVLVKGLLVAITFIAISVSCTEEKEVIVEKEVVVNDTIFVNNLIKDTIYITKHDTVIKNITVVKTDTIVINTLEKTLPQKAKDILNNKPNNVRELSAYVSNYLEDTQKKSRFLIVSYWTDENFEPVSKRNKIITVAYKQTVEDKNSVTSYIVMRPVYYEVFEQDAETFVSRSLSENEEGFRWETFTNELPVQISKHSYVLSAYNYNSLK